MARDVFLYDRRLMVAGPQALVPERLPALRVQGARPALPQPAGGFLVQGHAHRTLLQLPQSTPTALLVHTSLLTVLSTVQRTSIIMRVPCLCAMPASDDRTVTRARCGDGVAAVRAARAGRGAQPAAAVPARLRARLPGPPAARALAVGRVADAPPGRRAAAVGDGAD